MVWIQDSTEVWVNLNNWDFLEWVTVEDKETNLPFANKFIVRDRLGKEYTLGYRLYENKDGGETHEKIIKGMSVYLHSLESVLLDYLRGDFELKEEPQNFTEKYDLRIKYVQSLIGSRFFETE